MAGACGLQMDGPLAPLAAGFEESLAAVGYSQERVRQLMDLLAEVSHWLGAGGLCANDLTGEVVDEFFAERKSVPVEVPNGTLLPAGHRALAFDRRGSGTSDRSWTGEAATIEAQMDDIRAVMDAASSGRATAAEP